MVVFTADIAGMLEIFAIAAGLVVLHRANKEPPAMLLKAAGWVLATGGIVVGLCTTYYFLKYRSLGELESAHMGHPGTMQAPGSSMGPGMGSMPHGTTPPTPRSEEAR